ncbi:hypothetical protein SAMN05216371_6374 [Streptomyces sp. TLI_053]|uniref:hypothetical protein n=1 Tax=Streptomyces sp. TLI_053 TaxID=1855352 RepID=UPI00087D887D|nr:hypothetical protein [Streptomyces sp. TLI_053]SDT80568.1 hypothetical protein SAMN05216371_6374 [Streptomyces sp. TLI_053]
MVGGEALLPRRKDHHEFGTTHRRRHSTLALALGGVVAPAPAAHATPPGCFYYALEHAPDTDQQLIEEACATSGAGGEAASRACYRKLRDDRVPTVIAADGCRKAGQE